MLFFLKPFGGRPRVFIQEGDEGSPSPSPEFDYAEVRKKERRKRMKKTSDLILLLRLMDEI